MINNIIKTEYTSNSFDVSVIIVNWNSGKYLEETINSLQKQAINISYEIILIDNNSSKEDESFLYLEKLTQYINVCVIRNEENLGFAKANNKGMEIAKGRNFLLLNPDIILHNNVLKILSDYLDNNKDVAMTGPKVLNVDGSFQHSCLRGQPYPKDTLYHIIGLSKKYPNNEKYNKFALLHLNTDEINECGGLSGCCMMIKKSLYDEIGGMDENFFMYEEETDWCFRATKSNKKIIYNPEAVVTHYQGVTTNKLKVKSIWIFTQSMMKFFKKHFWSDYNIFQKAYWTLLIYGNFFLKLFIAIIRGK